MKICDICGKSDDDWKPGFAFAYKLDDSSQHYYCPECTAKRLNELVDKEEENKI